MDLLWYYTFADHHLGRGTRHGQAMEITTTTRTLCCRILLCPELLRVLVHPLLVAIEFESLECFVSGINC